MSDIPETKQGLINYMRYCVSECEKLEHKRRALHKRHKICQEKLDIINKSEEKDNE